MQKGQRSIVERKIGLEYALEDELQIIPDTQTPETNKITYILETQQEIQEKTPTPNLCETPNINKEEEIFTIIQQETPNPSKTKTTKKSKKSNKPTFKNQTPTPENSIPTLTTAISTNQQPTTTATSETIKLQQE